MTAVNLRRVYPVRNMSRFYRLDVPPDLFGHAPRRRRVLMGRPSPPRAMRVEAIRRVSGACTSGV
jgi:hypothetical protein